MLVLWREQGDGKRSNDAVHDGARWRQHKRSLRYVLPAAASGLVAAHGTGVCGSGGGIGQLQRAAIAAATRAAYAAARATAATGVTAATAGAIVAAAAAAPPTAATAVPSSAAAVAAAVAVAAAWHPGGPVAQR